jgi:hypothetical protein
MKQLHRVYVFLLFLAAVASQSCIRDDLSNCISDKRVYFDYDLTLSEKGGINPEDITRINLFIFDENGLFVKEYIDEAPRLSPEYAITINDLRTGYYRFIAWCNLKDPYAMSPAGLVPGQTRFDDLRVLLQSINSHREVTEELKPLFFATHAGNSFEILGAKSQFIHLNLIKDTYRINVTVSGMESTLAGMYDYKLNIEDDNGAYLFDNDFASCERFTYTQPCRVVESAKFGERNDLKSSLTVLRLTEERKPRLRAEGPQPVLRLINDQTKEVVVEDDLIALIKEANQAGAKIDFETTYEFDIEYELSQESSLVVYIYINGWRLIRQPVPLG